jgi:hypothetical protein
LLKRFSLMPFPLLDDPQPPKTSGEDHHNDHNGILDHWIALANVHPIKIAVRRLTRPLIHIKSYSPSTILIHRARTSLHA